MVISVATRNRFVVLSFSTTQQQTKSDEISYIVSWKRCLNLKAELIVSHVHTYTLLFQNFLSHTHFCWNFSMQVSKYGESQICWNGFLFFFLGFSCSFQGASEMVMIERLVTCKTIWLICFPHDLEQNWVGCCSVVPILW
jgi:hypothetical protein